MLDDRLKLLRLMLRARRFDEAVLRLAGEIEGHHHVSHGLEASAAALGLTRRDGDLVATNYRSHAHLICLGHDPGMMLAEILGRRVPPQFGRAGSLHLSAPELGVLYTSAMVAAPVFHAVGYGLAIKRQRRGNVSYCLFGDGAVQEGVVQESLNLAMIWELPVVFVCENNASREDGRANAYQSAKDIAALAVVNRVEAAVADGRHVRQVVAALEQTAEGARTSSCPRFVEVRCGPWPGNATFYPRDVTGPTDIARARNSASDQWQGRDDPVLQEARELLAEGVAIDDLLRLDEETQSWIDDALVRARSWPDAERGLGEIALSDVWSGAA